MKENSVPATKIMIINSSFDLKYNILNLDFSLNEKKIPTIKINTNISDTNEQYREGILYSKANGRNMIVRNFYIEEANVYKFNNKFHFDIKCIMEKDIPTSFHNEVDEIINL